MILVTGGGGYIGSHTCLELLAQGYDVLIMDNFSNSSVETIAAMEKIADRKIPYFRGDIRSGEDLDFVFSQNPEIDSVVHFAGFKSVDESQREPFLYYENNIYGSMNLFKYMDKYNVNKLIFSSSATVYGDGNKSPLNEKTVTGLISNNYGFTKLSVENILKRISLTKKDWSIGILRYFNPVGAHPTGLIGELPKGIPNNLLPYITQVAIGELEYLKVYGDDYPTRDGSGVRDYVHVMDLANAHILALKNRLKYTGCEIWNVGLGTGTTVLEIIKAFEDVNLVNIPYKMVGRRDGDLGEVYADPTKIKSQLGWEPKYKISDMLEHSWKWQKHFSAQKNMKQ